MNETQELLGTVVGKIWAYSAETEITGLNRWIFLYQFIPQKGSSQGSAVVSKCTNEYCSIKIWAY